MSQTHHLALANIARIRHAGGIEADEMFSFVTKLGPINTLAERAPGFVWRLKDDVGDGATGFEVLEDDPNVIINLAVWESIETAYDFTYKTVHAKLMSRRTDWFDPVDGIANLALWWVPADHQPTVAEAVARMRAIYAYGASPEAFTFNLPFSASGEPVEPNFPKKDCA
ncbi:MAG: DUF3291 domain-containing protein [Pseudomonadota bacterium]